MSYSTRVGFILTRGKLPLPWLRSGSRTAGLCNPRVHWHRSFIAASWAALVQGLTCCSAVAGHCPIDLIQYLLVSRQNQRGANKGNPLPCGRNSWLRSVGSRLTGDFSGAHHNLFYYRGSNLRGHSRFHHGNSEQYWDGGILNTTPQCFSYHDYPSGLVIESSAGHDYEVRDKLAGQIPNLSKQGNKKIPAADPRLLHTCPSPPSQARRPRVSGTILT